MNFRDNANYDTNHQFTNEEHGAITPEEIARFE